MENFTPLSATVGGLLLGLATSIIWVVNGRLAGVSSIAGGIFPLHRGDVLWRVLFVVAIPIGTLIGFWVGPMLFAEVPATRPSLDFAPSVLVIAGILVGIGTRMGRGCTSGHGICGLSRLSRRSIVAVLTFMATAALTVFVVRHVL
ncbi:MAG: YeeE/YedE family protein [Hyphomicrobiales bacterium]|nr:YeeE/YedE family protein [Hyphomicrobiales bacterium]